MTTVYVHDDDEKAQTIHCSDGTQGIMQISENDSAPMYNFNFYGHAHLGFCVDQDQFHNGEEVDVKGVLDKDQFQLKFV